LLGKELKIEKAKDYSELLPSIEEFTKSVNSSFACIKLTDKN